MEPSHNSNPNNQPSSDPSRFPNQPAGNRAFTPHMPPHGVTGNAPENVRVGVVSAIREIVDLLTLTDAEKSAILNDLPAIQRSTVAVSYYDPQSNQINVSDDGHHALSYYHQAAYFIRQRFMPYEKDVMSNPVVQQCKVQVHDLFASNTHPLQEAKEMAAMMAQEAMQKAKKTCKDVAEFFATVIEGLIERHPDLLPQDLRDSLTAEDGTKMMPAGTSIKEYRINRILHNAKVRGQCELFLKTTHSQETFGHISSTMSWVSDGLALFEPAEQNVRLAKTDEWLAKGAQLAQKITESMNHTQTHNAIDLGGLSTPMHLCLDTIATAPKIVNLVLATNDWHMRHREALSDLHHILGRNLDTFRQEATEISQKLHTLETFHNNRTLPYLAAATQAGLLSDARRHELTTWLKAPSHAVSDEYMNLGKNTELDKLHWQCILENVRASSGEWVEAAIPRKR